MVNNKPINLNKKFDTIDPFELDYLFSKEMDLIEYFNYKNRLTNPQVLRLERYLKNKLEKQLYKDLMDINYHL
jgi:hypothetical protein